MLITQPKTKMESENETLEKGIPFESHHFYDSASHVSFSGRTS